MARRTVRKRTRTGADRTPRTAIPMRGAAVGIAAWGNSRVITPFRISSGAVENRAALAFSLLLMGGKFAS